MPAFYSLPFRNGVFNVFVIFIIMMLVISTAAGIYIFFRLRHLLEFYGADTSKKWIKAVNIILAVIPALFCMVLFSNTAIIILHITAAFMLFDIIAYITGRIYGKRQRSRTADALLKLCQCGILPLLTALAIIGYGYYNMNHIRETEYIINTDKITGSYRVLFLSDIHYGTVQDTKVLKDKISEINSQHPDIVILGGDITEEGTSKEEMQEVFGMLGRLENKHGIYYVYGNHDRQPYTSHRTYTDEELGQAILQNGITILEDNYVEIGKDLILAGRADATMGKTSDRLPPGEILKGADKGKYIIMADHQPAEAAENNKNNVDLEISGHTHGGQIWPAGPVSEIAGVLNYGEYKEGNCKIIVSSGIAGWTYSMRTGKHCEYVVIDIKGKR